MHPSLDSKYSAKRVSLFLIAAWAVSIMAATIFQNFWLTITSLFLGGVLPFALLAIWLPRSRLGQFFKAAASIWQLRIFGISALFLYSILANKWASDVINTLFGVDPSHFGLSKSILAILFAPFGLLYRQDVISLLWLLFIVASTLLSYLLPFSLLPFGRTTLGWKAWLGGVLFVFCGAYTLATSAHISGSFHTLAIRLAIWADFNENHLCTNDWANKPNRVVFLADQRVLVYFPQNPLGNRFSVQSCNYARSY